MASLLMTFSTKSAHNHCMDGAATDPVLQDFRAGFSSWPYGYAVPSPVSGAMSDKVARWEFGAQRHLGCRPCCLVFTALVAAPTSTASATRSRCTSASACAGSGAASKLSIGMKQIAYFEVVARWALSFSDPGAGAEPSSDGLVLRGLQIRLRRAVP